MVLYTSQPNIRITTNYSGTGYVHTNQQFSQMTVTRVENGVDIATLWMTDRHGWVGSYNWLNTVAADEDITIEVKDESESTWTTILDGIVRFIKTPMADTGELLQLKCRGAGYGFKTTACGEEYGAESNNPSLDTLKEIITDATNGIVPAWVNDILGTGVASGFNYSMTQGVANDLIENIAGVINYLYSPYKPNQKTLNDLCDIVQAIKGVAAGPHWVVLPNDKLIVTTIGSHHAAAVTAGWTTYYGGSQAASTLEQGCDFKLFEFEQMAKEANYILYHGAFMYPGSGDKWTENNDALWGETGGVNANHGKAADNVEHIVGSWSEKFWTGDGAGANWVELYYPAGQNAGWDMTKWGGRYNIPQLGFFMMRDTEGDTQLDMKFYTDANDYYYYRYTGAFSHPDKWYWITVPVGPYAFEANQADNLEIFAVDNGDLNWNDINYFSIYGFATVAGNQANFWVDNCHFGGYLLRGAKQAGIGAANKLRVKLITDDVAKDDSMLASDDTGTMARMAYAELLRAKSTPIAGYVITPMIKGLLPGQLMHIHAKQKRDGSFNIDKDMRVTKLVHHGVKGAGFTTKIWLTDDVTNSIARAPYDDMNKILSASRPEFQDRQATSIKARKIDITQAILEKAY